MRLAIAAAVILVAATLAVMYCVRMPGRSFRDAPPPLTPRQQTLRDELQQNVRQLAALGPREIGRPGSLEAAAEWIESELRQRGYEVRRQEYELRGVSYRNLEVELRGASRPDEIIIVGAHYDSVPGSPGADDNASGVAGMLALARIFAKSTPAKTVRFVAFVNEEPPQFLDESMGSLVYARRSAERREKIVAMLSLESIGYYRDEHGSQQYPHPLSLFYPSRADFIAFVSNLGSRPLLQRALTAFRAQATIPSEGGALPEALPGVSWSDQWAFWKHGWPALMITDTALFRNPHYHAPSDTPETIDYDRLTRVVDGLVEVVQELCVVHPERSEGSRVAQPQVGPRALNEHKSPERRQG
jgi:hypothetical protein